MRSMTLFNDAYKNCEWRMVSSFSSVPSTAVAMRFTLVAVLISALALSLAQSEARTLGESGSAYQESNDVHPTHWPIDILKREVNYELMFLVDERLKRIHNEDLRNEIRNFVVRKLRQCIGGSSSEESNCVMRATILYRQNA